MANLRIPLSLPTTFRTAVDKSKDSLSQNMMIEQSKTGAKFSRKRPALSLHFEASTNEIFGLFFNEVTNSFVYVGEGYTLRPVSNNTIKLWSPVINYPPGSVIDEPPKVTTGGALGKPPSSPSWTTPVERLILGGSFIYPPDPLTDEFFTSAGESWKRVKQQIQMVGFGSSLEPVYDKIVGGINDFGIYTSVYSPQADASEHFFGLFSGGKGDYEFHLVVSDDPGNPLTTVTVSYRHKFIFNPENETWAIVNIDTATILMDNIPLNSYFGFYRVGSSESIRMKLTIDEVETTLATFTIPSAILALPIINSFVVGYHEEVVGYDPLAKMYAYRGGIVDEPFAGVTIRN